MTPEQRDCLRSFLTAPHPYDNAQKLFAYVDSLLAAERAATIEELRKPVVPPIRIWYMRDNHTFRELPISVQGALQVLGDEIADGNTYGMLCSKHPDLLDSVHASDMNEWSKFAAAAIPWIERAVAIRRAEVEAGKGSQDDA